MHAAASTPSQTEGAPGSAHWLEVDPTAYRHNLQAFRKIIAPEVRLMAVVKANAYGHGARLIAPLAVASGVDYLGVHALSEYAEIHDLCGGVPVCLLGPILPEDAAAVVSAGVEPTVSTLEVAAALAAAARAAGREVAVHLKVETGTHRQGIAEEEIPDWCAFFAAQPLVRLRGLHTHFANIEDTTDHTIARRQLARLQEMRAAFVQRETIPELTHSACSAAAIVMEETHADMVRIGIGSYGLWPSRETFLSNRLSGQRGPELRPVLAWRARIAQIKEVPAGEYVGYGCTFRTTRRMRLAVLPIGYYDGYDRRLSGCGHTLIRGQRAPVVGRVCMNLTLLDVGDIEQARLGEVVTVIGSSGSETVSADTLATLCGTINYEIVTRLGRHIPRRLCDPPAAV